MATLAEQAPARLVKKLDAEPRVAETWTWAADGDRWTVTTDRGEVVTLTGPRLATPADLSCSCLLAPRCLHLLAVVAILPLSGRGRWRRRPSGRRRPRPRPSTPA
jgi:hypothetical protein